MPHNYNIYHKFTLKMKCRQIDRFSVAACAVLIFKMSNNFYFLAVC